MYPTDNVGRALLIPWSFGGILILGLVITSIFRSVQEMGEKNIIRHHYERKVGQIIGRTVTTSLELERREIELELAKERAHAKAAARPSARSPSSASLMLHRQSMFELLQQTNRLGSRQGSISSGRPGSLKSVDTSLTRQSTHRSLHKQSHILLLRKEKERFEAIRSIQEKSEIWKRWWRLSITLILFAIFWCVGALVFWCTERFTQGMTYWDAVYYGWVTLVTIGYGDFSPKSVAGRCFFVIWVQFAVPAVTILAQHLMSTVVVIFKASTSGIANIFLPQNFNVNHVIFKLPWLFACLPRWMQRRVEEKEAERQMDNGLPVGDETSTFSKSFSKDEAYAAGTKEPDIIELADQHEKDVSGKAPDAAALARQLALAIRRAARDTIQDTTKQYSFEEWVEFIRLIRFSAVDGAAVARKDTEDEGQMEWDWLAENSPMMSQKSEAEFVLERLCESLVRYLKRNPPHEKFADNVREQGEKALRLTGAVESNEEGETSPFAEHVTQPTQATASGQSKPAGSSSRTVDFRTVDFRTVDLNSANLHTVKEEDNEPRSLKDKITARQQDHSQQQDLCVASSQT
jgi:potassium channel subfamily K, other eukaryote